MMAPTTRTAALLALAAGSLALVACAAPAPAVPAVDLGQAAGADVIPRSGPGVPAPTAAPGLDGEYRVAAGEAAVVTLTVAGDRIDVLDVATEPGWRQVEDQRSSGEIDMTFVRDALVVSLDVEVDDGRLETDVDIESPAAPGAVTYDVAGAGSVTVEATGDRVLLVGQEAAAGWVATVDEQELAEGEVEIRFRDDGASRTVDFDADIDDGELTVDIDSRTGRDYAAPPVR
ncbi:hypothetical protein [Pseudonocardia sp.]|uniref:hypothetical protein n=1 Tax=Pseudonocardia sp. TaxID=60912 RepID=UPI00260B87F7|nr:hypothetical protein [Pseudonocardia sp.]